MIERELTPPKLNLTRHPAQQPMYVNMDTFFDFCFWMAEELQDLEARFDPHRNCAGHDCDIPFPDDLAAGWH
jgi:hypothetical protein